MTEFEVALVAFPERSLADQDGSLGDCKVYQAGVEA